MEPHLHCVAALWSPNTAILDSHRCGALSCDFRLLCKLVPGVPIVTSCREPMLGV